MWRLGRYERVREATHLIVSSGGNDALQNSDLLALRVSSGSDGDRARQLDGGDA
jgi:hypothetical protein